MYFNIFWDHFNKKCSQGHDCQVPIFPTTSVIFDVSVIWMMTSKWLWYNLSLASQNHWPVDFSAKVISYLCWSDFCWSEMTGCFKKTLDFIFLVQTPHRKSWQWCVNFQNHCSGHFKIDKEASLIIVSLTRARAVRAQVAAAKSIQYIQVHHDDGGIFQTTSSTLNDISSEE